jgi:hypothetical protein
MHPKPSKHPMTAATPTTRSRRPICWLSVGRSLVLPGLLVGLATVCAGPVAGQSLRPSSSGMVRQVQVARDHDFTFLRTGSQVQQFADRGYLIRVSPNRNFEFSDVSYPYTRPEVALFVERLSNQYRKACGEKLVVTSLTRPRLEQPPNASRNSVHQAGMGVDLRRSNKRSCRRWLEGVLLDLEGKRVLEAAYESRPPHYHVALFPTQYKQYVENLGRGEPQRADTVRVTRGDTLWSIARRHDTSVTALKRTNALRSAMIRPGQVLRLPR